MNTYQKSLLMFSIGLLMFTLGFVLGIPKDPPPLIEVKVVRVHNDPNYSVYEVVETHERFSKASIKGVVGDVFTVSQKFKRNNTW